MKYYSAIKRNKIVSFIVTWMDPGSVIQSEIKKRKILYINAYIWNLEKQYRSIYWQGRNRDAGIECRHLDVRGQWRVGQTERLALTYIHSDSLPSEPPGKPTYTPPNV